MQTEGQEINDLLCQFFATSPKMRPHFQLGIEALRRTEIGVLCERAGIKIDVSQPKDRLVQIVNGLILEGRLDHLRPKPPKDELAEMRAELAAMRAKFDERPKLTVKNG